MIWAGTVTTSDPAVDASISISAESSHTSTDIPPKLTPSSIPSWAIVNWQPPAHEHVVTEVAVAVALTVTLNEVE